MRHGATVDKLQHRSPTLIYSISTLQTIISKQVNTRVSFAHEIFVESKVYASINLMYIKLRY